MSLILEAYPAQLARWPQTGRHILAQYDDDSVIVYQAYRPAIGHYAVRHGHFGGEFSFTRMSWVKPNFLWMMHRSGWAHKEGQEIVLAVCLKRAGFDNLLVQAVHSSYFEDIYHSEQAWKQAVEDSEVRLQWDPDHDPAGAKVERRAIQLGMRGQMLARYAREWIIEIEDITTFVHEQYQHVQAHMYEELMLPREQVYPISDTAVAARIGLTSS